jgi:hypothetical protein
VLRSKFKIIAGAAILAMAGAIVVIRTRAWPDLPNSPVPLGELIDKSDLIVHAKVVKIENPIAPLYAKTNRWIQKAITLLRVQERQFATAQFDIIQSIKGPAFESVPVNYAVGFTKPPALSTDGNTETVAFLYRQRGAYHPVAYSYGTKLLNRKDADNLLRYVAEFVATEKLSRKDRERARAEWYVKLIETPSMRWHGAASWLNENAKPGEALKKLPADLAKRIEAIALRDEPLLEGDEILLQEFSAAYPREVVGRLRRYFDVASHPCSDGPLEQPWHCIGAIQLLMRMADMPQSFRDQLDKGSYPNVSDSHARSEFINLYLPKIETRLRELGFAD